MKKENRLLTIDGETLMSQPLTPLNFVVDTLLSQGLHILAGSPKVGKSWLALWLCLCAAQGKPLWTFATRPCEVLYLCLEDSFQRIQSRLFDLTEDAPPASTSPPTATLSARAWRNSSARCLDKGNPRLCRGRKRAYSEGRSRQEKVSKLE